MCLVRNSAFFFSYFCCQDLQDHPLVQPDRSCGEDVSLGKLLLVPPGHVAGRVEQGVLARAEVEREWAEGNAAVESQTSGGFSRGRVRRRRSLTGGGTGRGRRRQWRNRRRGGDRSRSGDRCGLRGGRRDVRRRRWVLDDGPHGQRGDTVIQLVQVVLLLLLLPLLQVVHLVLLVQVVSPDGGRRLLARGIVVVEPSPHVDKLHPGAVSVEIDQSPQRLASVDAGEEDAHVLPVHPEVDVAAGRHVEVDGGAGGRGVPI